MTTGGHCGGMARKLTLGQMSKVARCYHPTLKKPYPLSPVQLTRVKPQGLYLAHDLKQDHYSVADYPRDQPVRQKIGRHRESPSGPFVTKTPNQAAGDRATGLARS